MIGGLKKWKKEKFRKEGSILKGIISLEICKIGAFPIEKIFVFQGGSWQMIQNLSAEIKMGEIPGKFQNDEE